MTPSILVEPDKQLSAAPFAPPTLPLLEDGCRLIVATHHLPFTFCLSDSAGTNPKWTMKPRSGHSALFSGIRSLSRQIKDPKSLIHVGWVGQCFASNQPLAAGDIDSNTSVLPQHQRPIDDSSLTQSHKDALSTELATQNYVPIFLDESVSYGHYEGYCKTDLWPLFHYILWETATDGLKESKYWANYVDMNQAFADKIASIYEPGDDIVWIHDYHLLLAPSMIRKKVPKAKIGFFLHTPFPSSEIFRCLPKRKEILEGVLGSNLIGFQTYSYARHFISSCTRVLGLESSPTGVDFEGSLVSVGIFPIGIDVNRVETYRKSQATLDKADAIRELYSGKKIIIGRDKLDHIKGVQHKLHAFEKFLTLYPEWHNKVVLIQVTSPPQRDNPKLEAKVSELVSRINGSFGSLEFVPVHHYHQHLQPDEYFSLLSVADVGLITSVRDGMNTTSHEFVICQQENHGPLILSEFTGTAGSLSAAILVNPWDYLGVANAINEALTMPIEEKSIKHRQLYNHVTARTVDFWATSFAKELRETVKLPEQSDLTPFLDFESVYTKYKASKMRLLLFDYDGTLTPIVKIPSAAKPSAEMLEALKILTADPCNYVFVISGRDQACLDEWLGHIPNLGFSAEHGSFIKYPGDSKWINLSEQIDFSWKSKVTEIFQYYTERTQGSFIEHKRCSITWHYRLADPDYGLFQAKECQNHLENAVLSKLPVEVMIGKKNLEVRPISINKGEIVKRLVASRPGTDFVFCAGDDKTDEDMFKALRRVATAESGMLGNNSLLSSIPEERNFTCTIGPSSKKTKASWHLNHPFQLIRLLRVWANLEEIANANVEPPPTSIETE